MSDAGPGAGGTGRRLPLLALIGANAVSWTGNMAALVAVPWFVLGVTGSAAQTGLAGAALALGTVLSGVFAGPVVDRIGHRKTSVAADLASGATTAAVPLLYLAGALEFWALLLLVFLGAVLDAPGNSARSAMIPGLAGQAGMPLERANSAFGAVPRLALLVGTPLTGALIAAFGATTVLLLNAATFSISAALVALFVPPPDRGGEGISGMPGAASGVTPSGGRRVGTNGYFADLAEGARFVAKSRLVLTLVLVVTFVNTIDDPLVSVVLPVYAKTHWGSAASLGLLFGAAGAGALAGTAAFGAAGHRLPRRSTFAIGVLIGGGIEYAALLVSPSWAVAVAAFTLAGFLFGPIDPIFSTVLQERAPGEMLGRLFGLSTALATAGAPLGLAVGGFLVEGVGLQATIAGMAAASAAVGLWAWLDPALRGMNAPEKARADRSPDGTPGGAAGPSRGSDEKD